MAISVGHVMDKMSPVATWNLRDISGGEIKPFTEVAYQFETRQSASLLSLKFTLPSQSTGSPLLHIGRISFSVNETEFEVPLVGESTTISTLYIEQIKSAKTQVVRNHIRPLNTQFRSSRLKTEFEIDPFRMHGFSVLVKHKDRRASTQVRELRMVVSHMNLRGEVFQQTQLGVFVIPKVQANTTLYFDFEAEIKGNIMTFECLSTYGDDEMCPPGKIQLY